MEAISKIWNGYEGLLDYEKGYGKQLRCASELAQLVQFGVECFAPNSGVDWVVKAHRYAQISRVALKTIQAPYSLQRSARGVKNEQASKVDRASHSFSLVNSGVSMVSLFVFLKGNVPFKGKLQYLSQSHSKIMNKAFFIALGIDFAITSFELVRVNQNTYKEKLLDSLEVHLLFMSFWESTKTAGLPIPDQHPGWGFVWASLQLFRPYAPSTLLEEAYVATFWTLGLILRNYD